MHEKRALVLEGGGMRGVFTTGVLDAMLDAGMSFPYVVGVSAGACNGCSFVTRQRGRARFSNIEMVRCYGSEYLGVSMLLKTGNIFNVKLLYDDLPNRLWPFDYDTFFSTSTEFDIVTTNLVSGRAEYFSNHLKDYARLPLEESRRLALQVILASSSLPYVSRKVFINGTPMLDGGIVDSIPVKHAMEKGYEKSVVILTRNKGYRKPQKSSRSFDVLSAVMYRKYPAFCKALHERGEVYNSQLDLVDKLEAQGSVYVLRPERPIEVDRIERDVTKLEALYDEGYAIGETFCRDHSNDTTLTFL